MIGSSAPRSPAELAARGLRCEVVGALEGALAQKLWLTSPAQVLLQLRAPGRSVLVLVDQSAGDLALLEGGDERPAAPERALLAQAPLRRALDGAQLATAELRVPLGAPAGSRPFLQLSFHVGAGLRSLVADPRVGALLLTARPAASEEERVIWAGPGAHADARPGSVRPPSRRLDAATVEAGSGQESRPEVQPALPGLLARSVDRARSERKGALLQRLRAQEKRLSRAIAAVGEDAARAASATARRRDAELLLPHQHAVPRGAAEVVVPDWSTLDEQGAPAQVRLRIDPALSAAENAGRWLQKAQRYGAARVRIAARATELAEARRQLLAAIERVERAADAQELEAAEQALPPLGPPSAAGQRRGQAGAAPSAVAAHRGPGKERGAGRLPYRSFRASTGAPILVGRSAKDNDALTFRCARGDDLWLHARGVQGSHVVLAGPGPAPDPAALAEAALLAAWFSSARGEEGAEVSWTRKKHVRKARGAAPGAVVYTNEKTLRIRLEPARVQALLATEVR